VVLDLMVKAGAIDAAERDLALQEPLRFAGRPYPIEAPHFVMMVQNQLDTLLAPFAPAVLAASGGLTVRTTLDLDWQHHAERIVSHQLAALNRPADGGPGHNTQSAALVALDPGNGQILALVGSPDYFDPASSGAINMALAPRQPGSAIKPLVYAAAFDPSRPTPWTAATMILDVATTFHTHEGDPYTPVNFDRREHGPVLAREALASSLNVPAVKALQHAGPKAVLDLAQAAGIDTLGNPDRYDLSLALGGGEVPLLQLTAAYAAFANGGYAVSPLAILHVADSQGRTVYTAAPPARRPILDERAAWLIGDILADDVARAPAFGRHSALQLDRPAAAKTGTTNDYRDNWTVGYTPDLVTGVWVGNPDMTPMRDVTGLSGAGPIWHQFMRTVLAGRPEQPFTRPPGLVQVEICTLSGLLPTAACPYRRREWFIAGTEPAAADTFYQMVTVDTASGRLATESTLPAQQVQRLALALPPQAHSWARAQGLLLVEDLLPPQAVATAAAASEPPAADRFLQLVQPAANAVFRLAPDVPVGAQSLRLAATVPGTAESVTFWVDGARLATLDAPPWQAWWPLQPGDHRAWVEGVTPAGERLRSETISFQVLARE
jgi:membrane carboxypeptidase/penicillin-binding protein PbpC